MATTVGFSRKKKKPWISDETLALHEECRAAKLKTERGRTRGGANREHYRQLQKKMQNACTEDCNRWASQKADDLQAAADRRDIKAVFENVSTLTKSAQPPLPAMKDLNGQVLRTDEQCRERWKQHFEQLLNRPPPTNPLPESDVRNPDDTDPPSLAEVKDAIKKLKNGKAPGLDNIPPDALKSGGWAMRAWVHRVIRRVWETGEIPADWKKGCIIPFFKKGDATVCSNYRGITLRSVPEKVFGIILLGRIDKALKGKIRDTQCGFSKGKIYD